MILTIIMAVTLVIVVLITVLSIVMSTSRGTDWIVAVWKSLIDRRKPGS